MADTKSLPVVSLYVDAEPSSPNSCGGEISNNFRSDDLSADAIAGVPPRTAPRGGPAGRPVHSSAQPLRGPPIPSQPIQISGSTERMVAHSSALPPRPVPSQPVQSPEAGQHGKGSVGSSVQRDEVSVCSSGIRQVPSDKGLNDDSLDSSYGSSFNSMESCSSLSSSDWERELEEYKDIMPTEVREDYYDVMILYTETDYREAEKFRQHLINEIPLPHNEKCRAVLYDCPELTGLSGSKIQHLDKSMERCTYVFVYMTADFVDDKWCEFSSESCLMRAIYDEERRWCVVPVYNERRTECKFRIPMGLNSLKGINYYCNDEFYRRGVSRLIGDKIAYRKKMQELHKVKQKKWLENYKRELIKTEEIKKREATEQKRLTEELERKIGLFTDSQLFPNQNAKMHNSFSESHLSSKGCSFPHSASSGSLKPVPQQNPAVLAFLQALRNNFQQSQQSNTQEQIALLSRILEPDGNSPPTAHSNMEKFQGLNMGSQTSGVSADMGVRSEMNQIPGDVKMKISPENLAYLESLGPDQKQKYLDSLLISQQESQRGSPQLGSRANLQQGQLISGLNARPYQMEQQTNLPCFDNLSINTQHHSSISSLPKSYMQQMTNEFVSSSVENSCRSEHPDRTMENSQGNVPTHLFEDSGSILSEDSGSLQRREDWTLVDQNQIPKITDDGREKKKGGKKKQIKGKEMEMVEKTDKKGRIVHKTIYHIYQPRAVQIGEENLVQDMKIGAEESGPDSDNETEVKGQGQKSDRSKNKKKGKKNGSDEEDSIAHADPHREMGSEHIPGEMHDEQHNSGGTVVMDAAPSTAGSYHEDTILGQVDFKSHLPGVYKDPVLNIPEGDTNKSEASKPTTAAGTARVKPEIPAKPRINLPVREHSNRADPIEQSPGIVKKVFQRPMAKIGPSVRNNNADDNTCLKTVIQSDETALKCPVSSNLCETEVRGEPEGASVDRASNEPEAETTRLKQTVCKTSVERHTRSIQSFMPLKALEKAGQVEKKPSNGNEKEKEKRPAVRPFQARPFSITRHSDPSALFFGSNRNRVERIEPIQGNMKSIEETETINKLTLSEESGNTENLPSINLQEVPIGQDPLSQTQETLGFIPNDSSDVEDDLETDTYEFVENSEEISNSMEEVISSTESQTHESPRSRIGKILASLRGK